MFALCNEFVLCFCGVIPRRLDRPVSEKVAANQVMDLSSEDHGLASRDINVLRRLLVILRVALHSWAFKKWFSSYSRFFR